MPRALNSRVYFLQRQISASLKGYPSSKSMLYSATRESSPEAISARGEKNGRTGSEKRKRGEVTLLPPVRTLLKRKCKLCSPEWSNASTRRRFLATSRSWL